MKILPDFLQAAIDCKATVAETYAPLLQTVCLDYKIDRPLRLAAFLAQTGHESRGFEVLQESLNYTPESLIKTFGSSRISKIQAAKYGRTVFQKANQIEIANIVYGGRWGLVNLGNTRPTDGWNFRGQGLIQLTGRYNARQLTYRLRAKYGARVPDFEAIPSQLTVPEWAVKSAADFWDVRDLNELADDPTQFEALTSKINAGLIGMVDRVARRQRALALIAKFGVI